MRRIALLLSAVPLLACGAAAEVPPPVPVVTVPLASATTAPPVPPPLPPEPEGLSVVAPPPKVCELGGTLGSDGLELAAVAGGAAFAELSHVPVTLAFGAGGAFVEARAPSWTMRGTASSDSARVHASRWLSFGGVFYAGASDRLRVDAARDGKLVLAAPEMTGFTLAEGARTAEAPCDGVAVDPDPHGALQDLPAAFLPDKKDTAMLLSRRKAVPVAASADGQPAGTIDAAGEPSRVTLLERRGRRARIRWGHVAGWVDASLLTPPRPVSQSRLAMLGAAQFGMIGLLGAGPANGLIGASVGNDSATPVSTLLCSADVRILANVPGSAGAHPSRFVVGAIPAGKPVRVTDRGPEIAHLDVDDGLFGAAAIRLAVPTRDIAAGCNPAPDEPARGKADHAATADASTPEDAIDRLGGEGPETAPTSAFGLGGLGLSGVGEGAGGRGEGIGLGSIGTIGHGAGTGTGQGFGSGHGSLGGAHSVSAPVLREGAIQVTGRLPPEVIQRIVRQNFGRFRLCYQNGLSANPTLTGKVSVRFVIDKSGAVTSVANAGSDLPDTGVVSCVVHAFTNLSFPQPEGGVVTVVYPVLFFPGSPK